jgi:hypothetical protein
MQSKYLSKEKLHYLCCEMFGGYGKKMCKLREPIDHHINTIFSLHLGKPCDEVHRDVLSFLFWDGKWLK